MSDFISRLKSIKRAAEERALESGPGGGSGDTARHAEKFAAFVKEIADLLLERCEKFRDEFTQFDVPRSLPLPGGHCVRLSLVERTDESKRMSRLAFSLTEDPDAAEVRVVCKAVVANRERGMHEHAIRLNDPDSEQGLRLFAEERLLEFAESVSDPSPAST